MSTLAEPQLTATPLIDVLLVLLVMLIFTLPVATHAVKLNLPHPAIGPPSPAVMVNIDVDGDLYCNGQSVSATVLERKFRESASAATPPRVKIVPDKRARYENVAQVLASAQRSGVTGLEVLPID